MGLPFANLKHSLASQGGNTSGKCPSEQALLLFFRSIKWWGRRCVCIQQFDFQQIIFPGRPGKIICWKSNCWIHTHLLPHHFIERKNKRSACSDGHLPLVLPPWEARECFKLAKGNPIDDYNKAITLDPGFQIAYSNRGEAKIHSGDKKGGCSDLFYSKKLGLSSASVDKLLKANCH